MSALLLPLLLLACGKGGPPDWCEGRADDPDCDGVATELDRCPDTELGAFTDRVGCSENQAAACSVSLSTPEDGAKATGAFRWSGTCDVYLLQFSEDPDFPPARTRTAARTTGQAVSATGTEKYWRVQGGRTGNSSGFSTPARTVKW